MSFQGHSESTLEGHGSLGKFLRTEKKQMSLLFSRSQKGGSRKFQTVHPYLNSFKSDVANKPGKHFQGYEGQQGDWKESAWLYEEEI